MSSTKNTQKKYAKIRQIRLSEIWHNRLASESVNRTIKEGRIITIAEELEYVLKAYYKPDYLK